MRKPHLVWLVGVCAMLLAGGVAGLAQTSAAEAAVMQAIERINLAFQNHDIKTYESLITPDYVRVGSSGRAFGRDEWLKTVAAAEQRFPSKYDQVSVRLYGDAALVTYRNMPTGPAGQPGAINYLTRVMARDGSQWKMALAQSTDTQPPAAPTGPEPAALPAWSASSSAERDALAAFQSIQKASASRDIAAWERLSAPDHYIIGADGARTSRAERVAALKAPPPAGVAAAAPEQNVRLIVKGDLAAVTWSTGAARSLKVLVRKAGQWQQVLQQTTPIVPGRR